MANIATNLTIADGLPGPGQPSIARRMDQSTTTEMYAAARTSANVLQVYKTTNSGTTWAPYLSFTKTGLQEVSSIVIDAHRFLHIAYRVSTTGGSGTDTIWYRRAGLSSNTWSTEIQISGVPPNGGVPGSRFQGMDLAVVRNPNGSYAIMVANAYQDASGGSHGIYLHGVSITPDGKTIYLNNGIITSRRYWFSAGTPGRQGVAVELEHNGDGFTSSAPHAWVCWGRNEIRMVKVAWVNSTVGWQGPANPVIIRNTLTVAQDHMTGRWDGSQFLIPVANPDDTDTVRVYQRNRANTTTSWFDSPAHPQGTIKTCSITYDNTTKNFRVFAVGTSAATLYYVDYTRATGIWGDWTQFSATAVTSSTEWGLRRGGNTWNAKYDVVTMSGAANPFTLTHTAQGTSTPPAIPKWNTNGQAYINGGAANVNAALPLAWTFSDVDPGQTQGSYALSRQIGNGTIAYWRASDSTWQPGEVQNTSATNGVTLASGWGADSDATHSYKVKVWDNNNTVAPGYSATLALTPSVPVNPTIVTPTAAQVLTGDKLTVTWTAAEQTGVRIRLSTNPGGTVVYDSGALMGYAETEFTLPYLLPNLTGWTVTLNTFNNEQLQSVDQTRNFTVNYAPPPAAVSTFTPLPSLGVIRVASANLAPVGTQANIVSQDLYRRRRLTANMLTNSDFNGNTNGWYGWQGTLSYSTAQKHSGVGSARIVPTGGLGDAQIINAIQPDISSLLGRNKGITVSGWVRPDTANKPVRVQINWLDANGDFLAQEGATVTNAIAGAWLYVEYTGYPDSTPGVVRAAGVIGLTNTPAVGDAFYVDDIVLTEENTDQGVRVLSAGPAGTTHDDWGPASGVEYEYRWVTQGDNGTSGFGPWMS